LFTPAERRGALIVALLFALGAVHDLWRAAHPRATPPPATGAGLQADDPGGVRREGRSEVTPRAAPDPASGGTPAPRIDLNRATVAQLDALPGIGPVLAQRIVEHRRLHGEFRAVEELMAVRGIGPKLFARLEPRLAALPAGGARSGQAPIVRPPASGR
jgi:competence ComEA-like helix-hairpin-helix protein